jgi:metacaspase-1
MKNSSLKFILILLIMLFSSDLFAAKKALLVGIGEYNSPKSMLLERMPNLKGPANDVMIIKNALMTYYGFKEEDIQILLNNKATRNNIENAFNSHLVEKSSDGDLVVFYYSGHGTRVPDYSGSAPDGFEEALCPVDTVPVGGYNIIINRELALWTHKLPGRTAVMIMDCCHSGGMVRGIRGRSESVLEETGAYHVKFFPITDYQPSAFAMSNIKGTFTSSESIILLAASRKDQSALEVLMPDGFHGGFTYGISEAIRNNFKTGTYKNLFDYAAKVVKDKLQLPQEPQIVSKKHDLATEVAFSSSPRSKFKVSSQPEFPAPQPPVLAKPPQQHDIASSSTTASKPPKPAQHAGTPHVQTAPSSQVQPEIAGEKVLVQIDAINGASPESVKMLRRKLNKLPYVKVVESGFFDRLIRGEYNQNTFSIRLLSRLGDVNQIELSQNIDRVVNSLASHLEYAYVVKQLSKISNLRPPFMVEISLPEGRRDFQLGEKIVYTITSEKNCYITLLNLDSQGNAQVIFPNKYYTDNFIRANEQIELPNEQMQKQDFEFEFSEPAGEETVKVIASSEPLSLDKLSKKKFEESFMRFNGSPMASTSASRDMSKEILGILNEKGKDMSFEWSEDTIVVRSHPASRN